MKNFDIWTVLYVAMILAGGVVGVCTWAREQVPPGAPSILVIDPIGTGQPHRVLVQIDGASYWAEIQGPPTQPRPVNPVAPAPVPVNPAPAQPGPALPNTDLALIAQRYLYWIPDYHKQMADALQNDPKIATEADMGKRLIELRNKVGNQMGDALAGEIKTSNGLDANGKIVNRSKLIRVFMDVYNAQAPFLKPKPYYLEK
jgi:hypothetical protein